MKQMFRPVMALWLLLPAVDGWAVEETAPQVRVTPVTVTRVSARDLEVWETSVGQLHARTAPTVAAEVGGRIIIIHADVGDPVKKGQPLVGLEKADFQLEEQAAEADVQRLQALIHAQRLKVKRLRKLVKNKSSSQSALDDADAQRGALRAQLLSSRVRLQQAQRNIQKTDIVSPVEGRVDQRLVSVGDYVKTGTALFHVTSPKKLRVRLPFPESLGRKLRVGLPSRLTSPVAPDLTVQGKITEIRPVITIANRAIEVIVDVENPGPWEPGASVTGRIRIEQRSGALMLPETSVVKRPAGEVVYLLQQDRVQQRRVQTGLRIDGEIEIVSGLDAGDELVLDGAGFLTDGARVEVVKP